MAQPTEKPDAKIASIIIAAVSMVFFLTNKPQWFANLLTSDENTAFLIVALTGLGIIAASAIFTHVGFHLLHKHENRKVTSKRSKSA